MTTLTDFADAAITLPLLVVTWLFLLARRSSGGRDASARWLVGVGGAYAVILALKLAFGIDPALGAPLRVASPSGHTACAAAAYGGLALLIFGRRAGIVISFVVAVLVGYSRVALAKHSPAEVVIGGAVGLTATILLSRGMPRLPSLEAILLAAVTALVVTLDYGQHAQIEPTLKHVEARFAL